jgi:hypothetical protein
MSTINPEDLKPGQVFRIVRISQYGLPDPMVAGWRECISVGIAFEIAGRWRNVPVVSRWCDNGREFSANLGHDWELEVRP